MSTRNYIVTIAMLLVFSTSGYSQKIFSAKAIEERMAMVNDTLYASLYETSNKEYHYFLSELGEKEPSSLSAYAMDTSGWDVPYAPAGIRGPKQHMDPAFSDYPATNMRYEGATGYCKWLTEKYNADPKRKFRKVLFLLPGEKEWILAAKGGHPDWLYPWGSYYLANKKGFYMCNFKPVGDAYHVRDSLGEPVIVNYTGNPTMHAAEFPAEKTFYTMKVKSFFPNGFGIYNISGNAAEMTEKPGYAMGGSWNSYDGEISPTSIKQYNYPSPEVGFRVFMKIIEQ